MAKAVFFDRDGVLNKDVAYLYKIEELEWVEGALEATTYLAQQGYKLFVVTNQSGIARGYYTVADMERLHEHMQQAIIRAGQKAGVEAKIERFYYCPHYPEGSVAEYTCHCSCRKPKPGMLLQAMEDYAIDKKASFLIGDSRRDVEAAEAAGLQGYLFKGGSLLELVQKIVEGKDL